MDRGRLFGTMWAKTERKTPVMTFFEGEIIDHKNHGFATTKWGASRKIDLKHWAMFDGFKALRAEAVSGLSQRWVFQSDLVYCTRQLYR